MEDGRVAVLIPARNESASLGETLERLRRVLPQAEVTVIDDHSTDDTARIATTAGAEVLRPQGTGYAAALACGYQSLARRNYRAVLQLDADGQHPPEAAQDLLAKLSDADWVIGSRAGTDSPGHWSRRAGNALLSASVRLAGVDATDVTSGFWALGPSAQALCAAEFPREVADANVRVWATRRGLQLLEFPVSMSERSAGSSMHGGLQGARNLFRSLRAVWKAARS